MVDFRYHALSLVAVFLALGIGIVLGVTIGDDLVSDADRNLRDSLRDDVTEAREQARDEQELGSKRDDVIEEMVPEVAAGRLRGQRIALIAFGELPVDVAEAVNEGVELGGGRLVRRAVLPAEIKKAVLVEALPRAVPARGADRDAALGSLFGRLVERGGRTLRLIGRGVPRSFSGNPAGPVDAVVVYRHPPPDAETDEERADLELREAFEDGLFEGLRGPVVGVETLETDPSQVDWYYGDRVIASVDNVDVPAGRLALGLVLQQAAVGDVAGRAEGSFGYKDSADRPVPDLSD